MSKIKLIAGILFFCCGLARIEAAQFYQSHDASAITGTIPISNGGTGSTTAGEARTALSAAQSGSNSDITALTTLTSITPTVSVSSGFIVDTNTLYVNSALNRVGVGTTSPASGYSLHVSGNARFRTQVISKTATYSIVEADMGSIILMNSSTAQQLTLPASIPTGNTLRIRNLGTGRVTVIKTGTDTLNGNVILDQYSEMFISRVSGTKWVTFGGTAIVSELIRGIIPGVIVNQTYDISVKMPFPGTIIGLTTKSTTTTVAGTYTVAISGVSVTGLTTIANGATGVRTTTFATAANAFVAGDYITITFSGATITDMFFSLEYTRVY